MQNIAKFFIALSALSFTLPLFIIYGVVNEGHAARMQKEAIRMERATVHAPRSRARS